MATENSIPDIGPALNSAPTALMVLVVPMPLNQLETVLLNLTDVSNLLPGEGIAVATANTLATEEYPALRIMTIPQSNPSWSLTAADFVTAHQFAVKSHARSVLILGPESASLSLSALHGMAVNALSSSTDLAVPRYDLPTRAGMINSAVLYPLTQALFASRVRYPLAIDLGVSLRMAERLAIAAQRFSGSNQTDSLVWPVNEAAVAGFTVAEFEAGARTLPQPADADVNSILSKIIGSLFADIDTKAAFWQRTRTLPPAKLPAVRNTPNEGVPDTAAMLDAFRLGYTNLREIWSLVLPPHSLLGLKRLSNADAATFRLPDDLWARIVYDFLLSYRLRTINRGHLLGALIPLYLAWVVSHLNIAASGTTHERHIEAVAAAFEADKPYLVSRWRWPDRFNP